MTAVLFVVASAVGAVVRHGVNQLRLGWRGTLAVNAVGAFALGWVVASGNDVVGTVIGVGLLGSMTTFSTFSLEAVEAEAARRWVIIVLTVVLGGGAAAAGAALG